MTSMDETEKEGEREKHMVDNYARHTVKPDTEMDEKDRVGGDRRMEVETQGKNRAGRHGNGA